MRLMNPRLEFERVEGGMFIFVLIMILCDALNIFEYIISYYSLRTLLSRHPNLLSSLRSIIWDKGLSLFLS